MPGTLLLLLLSSASGSGGSLFCKANNGNTATALLSLSLRASLGELLSLLLLPLLSAMVVARLSMMMVRR